MTFRRGARLNPGQVRDARGSSGGSGLGLPGGFGFPTGSGRSGGGGMGIPAGGGIAGIVVLVIVIGIYVALSSGQQTGTTGGLAPGPLSTALASCQTGEDANNREDCRIVGYVNSVQAYWTTELPTMGTQYQEAQTTLFTDSYPTGCGQATAQTGPFYCPQDKNVYLDLSFFDVMNRELGGSSAPLAQAYVIAHEYGHHIQDQLGVLARSQDGDTGPTSNSVRIELQADCYAGVWAANAVDTEYIEPLSQSDVNDALSEAKAVGDDWIQQRSGGQINPEGWTHGSSEQRVRWFTIGYRGLNGDAGGDPADCDTFSATQL
jgi:predicted metalloprotease